MTMKRARVRNAKTTHKLRELIMLAMHNEDLSIGELSLLDGAKAALEWQLGFEETRGNRWLHNTLDGMEKPFDYVAAPFIIDPEPESTVGHQNVLRFVEQEDDGA